MQQSNISSQSPALRPASASAAHGVSSSATAPSPSVKPAKAATHAAVLPLSATVHGVDSLSLLPSHTQSCGVDPPRALRPFGYDALDSGMGDGYAHAAVVDVFGDVSSRVAIREKLLRFYEDTKQVATVRDDDAQDGGEKSEKKSSSAELIGDGISEMTLRIDTELELLRQQCFAERNAQWDYHTPDMFSYEPVREPLWNPLLVGNANIALRRLKHDVSTERAEKEAANAIAAGGNASSVSGKKDGKGFPLGQFSRERPWPPREFMQKATARPSRARGGKRKAPAPIMEQRSVFSKVCVECHTQSTPLWRKIARESTKMKKEMAATNGVNHVKSEVPAAPATAATANGALGNGVPGAATAVLSNAMDSNATALPADQAQLLQAVAEVDVCLECFLKLQRSDIFARKQLERAQKAREKQERIAAEATLEKKRLKQQIQMFKKQAQAKSKKRKPAQPQELAVVAPEAQQELVSEASAETTALKIAIKMDAVREDHVTVFEAHEERIEQRLQYEQQQQQKSAKRDKKKSKKDKKKKKKKKRRDDSDDDESDSGTLMPSPPQMVGQYEYADLADGGLRTSRSASSVTSFDAVVESGSVKCEDEPAQQQTTTTTTSAVAEKQEVVEEHRHDDEQTVAVEEPVSTSKRTRKSTSRRDSSSSVTPIPTPTATTTITVAASSSKSRKRKNSVVAVAPVVVVAPEAVVETQTTSSRSSRSRASASSAPAVVPAITAPAPVAAAVTTPARKRVRTKKESARERELRALGQYCPVCNAVYEEDDESSFVCCDSCEMWVHAACDTTLTPYVVDDAKFVGLCVLQVRACAEY